MMESEIFINYNHNTINMDNYLLCVSDGSVMILATPFIWNMDGRIERYL